MLRDNSEEVNNILAKDIKRYDNSAGKQTIRTLESGWNTTRMLNEESGSEIPQVKDINNTNYNKTVGVSFAHPLSLMTAVVEESGWADLSVRIISAACASTNPLFRIVAKNDGKKKSLIATVTDLLLYPNLNQSGYDLHLTTYQNLATYGNAYWQVIKTKTGKLHSFYTLPPETMHVIPWLDDKNILHFDYVQMMSGNRIHYFGEDEIIHFKLPNNKTFIYGKPIFYSMLLRIAASINAEKAIASWFEQGFAGGAVFKMDADAEVAERNREFLKTEYAKPENFGKALILEGSMEMVSDGNKFKDFDFSSLEQTGRDNILFMAGIPLSQAGVRSAAGQANSEVIVAEEKAFKRNTVDFYHKIVCNTLNNKLFRQILKEKDMVIQVGNMTQFSMKDAIDTAAAISRYGSTPNEIRDILSLERIENEEAGNNSWFINTNNGMVSAPAILGIDFNTGEKVDSIFDLELEMKKKELTATGDKSKSLTSGVSGTGGKVADMLEGK